MSYDKTTDQLNVTYKNANPQSFYIDIIPSLEDENFERDFKNNNFGNLVKIEPNPANKEDALIFKDKKCPVLTDYNSHFLHPAPIFLKAYSSKTYFFKIDRPEKGGEVIFNSERNPYSNFLKIFRKSNSNEIITSLNRLSNTKCGQYYYYTGDFIYSPKRLKIP